MGFILPYGYRMIGGETLVDEEKAAVICQVFASYVDGMSYEKIANAFPGERFDKHKVKRILENGKYGGEKGYPQIVDAEAFQAVRELQNKRTQHYAPVPAPIQAVRKTIFCDVCGGRYLRETKSKRPERWRCKNGCGPSTPINDESLMHDIHQLQGKIKGVKRALLLHKHNNDTKNKWNEGADDKAAYQQIIESTISAYSQCPDEYIHRKWNEIQSYQSVHEEGSWDADLFHLAVEKIAITADAAIQLYLYTGDIVK